MDIREHRIAENSPLQQDIVALDNSRLTLPLPFYRSKGSGYVYNLQERVH